MSRISCANIKSNAPKKAAITTVTARTIKVRLMACLRVGQLTLRSSPRVSLKYSLIRSMIFGFD